MPTDEPPEAPNGRTFFAVLEITIRLGLVLLLFLACFRIFKPFISLTAWGAVIAIAVHPIYARLASAFGGRRKLAATLVTLVGIGIILVPTVLLAQSVVQDSRRFAEQVKEGTVKVPPPPAKVATVPIVGPKIHAAWKVASHDLQRFVTKYRSELEGLGKMLLRGLEGVGKGVLQLVVAMIVAGAFLSTAEAQARRVGRFARRIAPAKGDELVKLSASTVRSVTVGILGIAFIQAVLAAVGFVVVHVPAAALWALLVFLLGVLQIPQLIVLLPIALWVLASADNQVLAWAFLVWSVLVGFSDALLKPLLLGRGIEVPKLVILLGAIGGMIAMGILGLFVGAVVLAFGYRIFMHWLQRGEQAAPPSAPQEHGLGP